MTGRFAACLGGNAPLPPPFEADLSLELLAIGSSNMDKRLENKVPSVQAADAAATV